ncbi:uncharacterized protein LOC113350676 [Papaver somniferum]|uniref:uncharacterized protein LOC113350676 n=1 Tax=Papaver somniferum TaxID=3469 RepID=UPI000E6F4CFC|nr:uncharacterized protein LOC113350676 [Papaver somniferum]
MSVSLTPSALRCESFCSDTSPSIAPSQATSDASTIPTPLASNSNYLVVVQNNPTKYKSLVGALRYLTWSRPDINFVVNQAGSPNDRRLTSSFCILFFYNSISWSAKKQYNVARSSTEAECHALAHTAAEVVWLCQLL